MIDVAARNGITTITLDRPEKLNAFAGTMREDLLAALRKAADDETCHVVVVTGAGRAFCAGGDVAFMHELQSRGDVEGFRRLLDAGAAVVTQIVEMPKPVIASINGVAAGAGCNLALACDYRIASSEAKLGETFVRIGLHPDWGGTWLLPRIVGRSRALELVMTGRMIDASEALAIGMIDRLATDLAAETRRLAESIAAAPPAVIADIKRALSSGGDLRAQLQIEREHQLRAFSSAEAKEKISAFLR
ncbi:MAG TPA: enoyl-CoA hydratase/isomerase family protein [Thermoanaerobaculia bacterium]|nr:enoyl-CoA hydratase/isomerase family protein [Thermoanaerobaculia bacterium]